MSRIGKKPVTVPKDVKLAIDQGGVSIQGPKGTLEFKIPSGVAVESKDNQILVKRHNDEKKTKSLHGLVRSVISNMVKGVTEGYSKELEVVGVGFRAQAQGSNLVLNLGFSHPVHFPVPEGIKIETPKQTQIIVKGIDKEKVGQTAALIRAVFPPEPYKGKGIRYLNEFVKRKVGKAVTK